ncbi:MAG: hypothetical protein WAO58_09355 [Fimbriimonadaceae bacterium]
MQNLMEGGQAVGGPAVGDQALTPAPTPSPFAGTNHPENEDGRWIERSAKLFETGDYPDKGVTITIENLNALADGFGEPVPVLIEHADSPLELGFLTGVQALGEELFGTVSLTPEANSLVERSGARALSLGLSPDLTAIREVSLVRNPRVESAQLYSGIRFDGRLGDAALLKGEGLVEAVGSILGLPSPEPFPHPPAPSPRHEPFVERGSNWKERYERLVGEQEEREADRLVREFVAVGKLCPAQAPLAKALLLSSDTVAFGGESRPLRQVAQEMIERQPRLALFSEIVPDGGSEGASSHLLLPEEAEFYRKHFPDVSLEEIASGKR